MIMPTTDAPVFTASPDDWYGRTRRADDQVSPRDALTDARPVKLPAKGDMS